MGIVGAEPLGLLRTLIAHSQYSLDKDRGDRRITMTDRVQSLCELPLTTDPDPSISALGAMTILTCAPRMFYEHVLW